MLIYRTIWTGAGVDPIEHLARGFGEWCASKQFPASLVPFRARRIFSPAATSHVMNPNIAEPGRTKHVRLYPRCQSKPVIATEVITNT